MHRGSANLSPVAKLRRKREALLKRVTDFIFQIIVAIVVLAVIALLLWNESELIKECQAEGHSVMYCIRLLSR